jgi:hypothetical protein
VEKKTKENKRKLKEFTTFSVKKLRGKNVKSPSPNGFYHLMVSQSRSKFKHLFSGYSFPLFTFLLIWFLIDRPLYRKARYKTFPRLQRLYPTLLDSARQSQAQNMYEA